MCLDIGPIKGLLIYNFYIYYFRINKLSFKNNGDSNINLSVCFIYWKIDTKLFLIILAEINTKAINKDDNITCYPIH